MPRVSRRQLDHLAELTNEMLESRGTSARLEVSSRSGYHALELTTAEYLAAGNGHTVRTLRLGSTGELETYVHAMREALWLLESPWRDNGPGE